MLNRNIFLTKPSHSKYFTVIRSKTHNEWLPILNSNGQVIRIDIGSLNQPSLSGISFWTTQDCNIILTLLKEYTSEVRLKKSKTLLGYHSDGIYREIEYLYGTT